VLTAFDGKIGLHIAKTSRPDLVESKPVISCEGNSIFRLSCSPLETELRIKCWGLNAVPMIIW
jgi:hypothetical protein